MTITTTADHGQLLEALSRLTVLIREHSEELPDLYVCLASDRSQVVVQVVEGGAAETVRRTAVDRLAHLLNLARPGLLDGRIYQAGSDLWDVYTPINTD